MDGFFIDRSVDLAIVLLARLPSPRKLYSARIYWFVDKRFTQLDFKCEILHVAKNIAGVDLFAPCVHH